MRWKMIWHHEKFDAVFHRYWSGRYEIVELCETLPDRDSYQLNRDGRFVSTHRTAKAAKKFAEELEKMS